MFFSTQNQPSFEISVGLLSTQTLRGPSPPRRVSHRRRQRRGRPGVDGRAPRSPPSHETIGHEMVWYGMVWFGLVWYGMVWDGMVCRVFWRPPKTAQFWV